MILCDESDATTEFSFFNAVDLICCALDSISRCATELSCIMHSETAHRHERFIDFLSIRIDPFLSAFLISRAFKLLGNRSRNNLKRYKISIKP